MAVDAKSRATVRQSQRDPKLYADKIEWAEGADVLRLKRAPSPSSFVGGGARGTISLAASPGHTFDHADFLRAIGVDKKEIKRTKKRRPH